MPPYALVRLSDRQLELLAASIEPEELRPRAEPGAFPPSFVAARSLELASERGETPWASTYLVMRTQDSAWVGACGFKGFSAAGRVEVGYGIAPSARGQGAATAAVQQLARLAFEHGAREVLAEVAPGNLPSLRVVQKAGFAQIGARTDEGQEFVLQWLLRRGDATLPSSNVGPGQASAPDVLRLPDPPAPSTQKE